MGLLLLWTFAALQILIYKHALVVKISSIIFNFTLSDSDFQRYLVIEISIKTELTCRCIRLNQY